MTKTIYLFPWYMVHMTKTSEHNKSYLRDLTIATGPVTLHGQHDLNTGWMDLQNYRAMLLCPCCIVHHFIAICEWQLQSIFTNVKIGAKIENFGSCNLEILQMTMKNNRTYTPLYHPETLELVQNCNFVAHVTLKLNGLWNTIGHLFYAPCNFVHHL